MNSIIKRNSYLNLAMLKYEETEEIRYVDMGYKEEAQYLTKMCKYYIIELAKFKKKSQRQEIYQKNGYM